MYGLTGHLILEEPVFNFWAKKFKLKEAEKLCTLLTKKAQFSNI